MTVGERIRQERERLGWSQDELAARMGYKGKATVSKAELHSGEITTAKVQKYAKALGVSFEYLMGWTEQTEKMSPEEERKSLLIMAYLSQLNEEGFLEATKRIGELTELSKYRKK